MVNKKPEPTDLKLYERVRKKLYAKIPKHSAYRSGLLVYKSIKKPLLKNMEKIKVHIYWKKTYETTTWNKKMVCRRVEKSRW